MDIAVGIVCLVAVAVPEGVTGFPDKQLTNNDNQIKENDNLSVLQDDEIERQYLGSLDRIACRIFDGQCQDINHPCRGEVKTGHLWCRGSRKFGCCIPLPPCDCAIDDKVYPNGGVCYERCISLLCNNGTWEYYGWNDNCGLCYAYDKTVVKPYITHNISSSNIYRYNITEYDGTYAFSQSGLSNAAQLGIDITLEFPNIYHNETCLTDVLYYEPGLTIELCFFSGHAELLVSTSSSSFLYTFGGSSRTAVSFPATLGTVFVIFELGTWPLYGDIYIVGSQGLSVYVIFYYYAYEVFVMAMPPLCYDKLYGLCDVFPSAAPPYPEYWTTSYGDPTNETEAFIHSWKHPRHIWRDSGLLNKHHHNPSREQTLQDTDRTIIERSSSEIEKMCEEMNKGPCTVLPSEECETLKEACVSRMSDESIPGNRTLTESSG